MNIGHIQGGTNAGWRKTAEQPRGDWKCPNCSARCKYFWANCPNCSHPRG